MTQEEFEKLVNEIFVSFPEKFKAKMKNVAITLQLEPDEFQKQKLGYFSHHCLLGLYEGVPQTQRVQYDKVAPDKITLFQKNIEEVAQNDLEKIKQLIKETLWHEIGHHFGMTEEEVQNFIQRKFKTN